jgi:hypothetical protein
MPILQIKDLAEGDLANKGVKSSVFLSPTQPNSGVEWATRFLLEINYADPENKGLSKFDPANKGVKSRAPCPPTQPNGGVEWATRFLL